MQRPAQHSTRKGSRTPIIVGGILVLGFAFFLFQHFVGARGGDATSKETTLSVVPIDREDLKQDLTLSAEFRPYLQIELHAKVAGYLKNISVDVGDHVKSGQKIAELEIPEIEDDLAKANSAHQASQQEVKRVEADVSQAELSYKRLLDVAKDHPKLVAQQDLDNAKAKLDATNAGLGSAQQLVEERKSELSRTTTLRNYASIVVPFDGIVTKRMADPGALIQAGTASNTQAMPLVELAQQDKLRLVFPVPESAAATVHIGDPVEVTVSALNETFSGAISRFSGKVDRDTRTMHTEVDVANTDGRYQPGMYAFVRLVLREQKNALAVPSQSVVTGEKPSVYLVGKDGVVERREVTLGLETPDKVEIVKGVSEGELVVIGNRKGVASGQKVQAAVADGRAPAK